MNDVNFSQVMERMGRRRLQNGNFAITLFNVRCFLLTCLHGPDRNWCAIAGQVSYAMCLWRRLFPWPQGCLGYMAKQSTWLLLYPYPLLVCCFFFFLEFQGKTQQNDFYNGTKATPWTHSTGCCEGLICAIIWAWYWDKPSLLAILDATVTINLQEWLKACLAPSWLLEIIEIEKNWILSPCEHIDLQGKCKLYIHLQSLMMFENLILSSPSIFYWLSKTGNLVSLSWQTHS